MSQSNDIPSRDEIISMIKANQASDTRSTLNKKLNEAARNMRRKSLRQDALLKGINLSDEELDQMISDL